MLCPVLFYAMKIIEGPYDLICGKVQSMFGKFLTNARDCARHPPEKVGPNSDLYLQTPLDDLKRRSKTSTLPQAV